MTWGSRGRGGVAVPSSPPRAVEPARREVGFVERDEGGFQAFGTTYRSSTDASAQLNVNPPTAVLNLRHTVCL